jgi:enoyl-CoA hydratase/carnithine racemase
LLLVAVDDGVATVTLNRPDRLNAMIPELQKRLLQTLTELDRSPDVRAIILTGAGRGFCAGADLAVMDNAADLVGTDALEAEPPKLSTPVIAAVNGATIGIGFAIMLFGDVIFAASGAKIGAKFAQLGLVAEWGCAWTLARRVGAGAAADILLTGRSLDADEAHALRLVDRVIEPDELMSHARAWARGIASQCSPFSTAIIKRQLSSAWSQDFDGAFTESLELEEQALAGPDVAEAIAALRDHREPHFD